MSLAFIPRIIPKNRLYGTIIGILITSTIFVSTNSVLFSMTEVSEDIFGDREDVFIFYNTAASTPFTSQVSSIYKSAFENTEGVITVSEEIFQAALIKGKSGYVRGVNYTEIASIDNMELIAGKEILDENTQTALIGEGLATRLNIQIGELIKIESIVTEERFEVEITGIYTSDMISNDELLISKPLGRALADFSENSVSHHRIKYDDVNYLKEDILRNAQIRHNLDIDLLVKNDTNPDGVKIDITHKSGIEILSNQGYNEELDLQLLKGQYKAEVKLNGEVIIERIIQLVEDTNIPLSIGNTEYKVDFNFTYNSKFPVTGSEIEILKNHQKVLSRKLTNGTLTTNLKQGEYLVQIIDDLKSFNFSLVVDTAKSISRNFEYNPIKFLYDINNSQIIEGKIDLTISEIDPDFSIKLNNQTIDPIEYSDSILSLNLEDDNYNISIEEANNNIYQTIFFEVNSTKTYFQTNQPSQNYLFFNDTLEFETNGLNMSTFRTNLAYDFIQNKIKIQFNNNTKTGVVLVFLGAETYFNQTILKFSRYYLTNHTMNWELGSRIPTLKEGDTVDVWFKFEPDLNTTKVQIINTNSFGYKLNITDIQLNSTQTIYNDQDLQFYGVQSYSSLFSVNNQSIPNDLILNSSYIIVKYPRMEFPYQSNIFWKTEIIYDDTIYSIYDGQKFYINETLGIIDIELKITNLHTMNSERHTIKINSTSIISIPNKISGLPNFIPTGLINLENWKNMSITIFQDGTIIQPIYKNNEEFYLPPGNYTMMVENGLSQKEWSFEIILWKISQNINTYISTNSNYVYQENTLDQGGLFYFNNNVIIIGRPQGLTFDYYYSDGNNILNLELDNIYSGNLTIQSSLEVAEININSTKMSIALNYSSMYEIVISYMNLNGIVRYYNTSIIGLPEILNYKINVSNVQNLQNYQINIELPKQDKVEIFQASSTTEIIHLTSIRQLGVIKIIKDNQMIFNGTLDMVSDTNISIIFGTSWINFDIKIPNFSTPQIFLQRIEVVNATHKIVLSNTDVPLNLHYGSYNLNLIMDFGEYNFIIQPQGNSTVELIIGTLSKNVTISVNRLFAPYQAEIFVQHSILNYNESQEVSFRDASLLFNIPLGEISITINGTWGEKELNFNLFDQSEIIVELDLEQDIEQEVDINQVLKIQQVGITISGDYLDSFLRGALLIVQSIIIVEIITMFIIILINFMEIIRFIVVESKNELKVIERLGGSKFQIIVAFVKPVIFLSIVLPVISLLISQVILRILFISNLTVFFGHRFEPSAFDPFIILMSFFITYSLLFISVANSINSEILNKE